MERDAFVRALGWATRDGSASEMLLQLARAAEEVEGDGLADLGAWYRSLDDRTRALVAELVYRTADLATYRFLRVLDGAHPFTAENAGSDLRLELRDPSGSVELTGREPGDGLHDLLDATSSAAPGGEPVRNLPVPEYAPGHAFRYLPAQGSAFHDLLLAYYRAKPELRSVFRDPDSPEFWRWVNVEAYAAFAEFREHLPPVPPPELRDVVSSGGVVGFLDAGFASLVTLSRLLAAHGGSFATARRVLDFGCGCGRLLRLLQQHAATAEIHGCDIDERAVSWCGRELRWARTCVSATAPPLPYDDDAFDLLYSISVFSHLEERNHLLWIAELARISEPGGLVVVTTHGPTALDELTHDTTKCAEVGLTPDLVACAREDLDRDGYAFCRQEQLAHETDLYGMTFVTREYMERCWSPHFEILAHEPRGLQDWQDVVVMRGRDRA